MSEMSFPINSSSTTSFSLGFLKDKILQKAYSTSYGTDFSSMSSFFDCFLFNFFPRSSSSHRSHQACMSRTARRSEELSRRWWWVMFRGCFYISLEVKSNFKFSIKAPATPSIALTLPSPQLSTIINWETSGRSKKGKPKPIFLFLSLN